MSSSYPDAVVGTKTLVTARWKSITMKKICFSCIIFLLTLGLPPFSMAGSDFTFNPSLQFRGEYDDNINFDNDNEISDWLGVFIPSLKASWKTPRLDINGSAGAEIRRFCSESQFDDEYQRYKIESSYQFLERLTLEAGGSYTKDSTLDSELEETGIVENLYDRERCTLNTGARYQLGERVFTGLHYNYGDTSYNDPGNTDYDSHSIVGSISYLFRNQRDQVFLQPTYYRYKSEVSKVDNYGLSLGWNRTLSEKLTLSCYLGIRYTDTEYNYHYYVPVFDPVNGTLTWQKRRSAKMISAVPLICH